MELGPYLSGILGGGQRPKQQEQQRQQAEAAYDFIRTAREEGPNIVQSFHESTTVRGGKLYGVIADVCAFANTNGGTLYIGLNEDPKKPVVGITNPEQAILQLDKEVNTRLSPQLTFSIDIHETGGKKILRVLIPRGDDPPYAVDDNKIYVRDEAETGLAVRDEIVGLVLRGQRDRLSEEPHLEITQPQPRPPQPEPVEEPASDTAPRTGVEVVRVEEREGVPYYTMRDLRNGNEVKNVTRASARRLWHYAITQHSQLPGDLGHARIQWSGDLGLLDSHRQGKIVRYDLVQRTPKGYRVYFGVTDDGIHGRWKALVGGDEE